MKSPVACLLGAFALFCVTQPVSGQGLTRWHLAEGATTSFFEDEILVTNPNGAAVTLTLTFLPEHSASSQQQITVAATSRATIRVNDYVSNDAVSVIVDATADVLVERTMYWPGSSRRGGHHSNGVTTPSLTWYFAEGSVNIFQEFVLVANPSSTTAAEVTVTFLRDNAQGPVTITRTVQPLKRDTIWVNEALPQLAGGSFSTVVQSTNNVPVLAERAMYWGGNYEGGHNATGTAAPAQTFRFAEGFTAAGFETYLLLANPGGATANVTITFYPEAGAAIPYPVTVDAGTRRTVAVNALPINPQGAFSMLVESDVPIVAERAMYWGSFIDGHSTGGATAEATAWGFAEGIEDGHGGPEYDTYYLFANASNTDATIEATFYRDDGTGFVDTFTVPAQTRYTLVAARYAALSYQKFSAFFRSTNAVPFVAERTVYWGDTYYGGHASLGTPWTGAIVAPPAVPPVAITGISPASGPIEGGTPVTITGDNFTRGTRVFLGGVEASNVRLSTEHTLTAVTGARDSGTVDVSVQAASSTAVLGSAFVYEAPAPPPPPPVDPDNIDLNQVTFLHRNIANWAQTSTITGVDITGNQICVYHTKAGQWPQSSFGDADNPIQVEGNVWVVAFVNGAWYAATYDWLRPGQECKFVTGSELGRDQIRIPPLDASWEPQSGDLIGFIVSTRARDGVNAGQERTNVHTIRWP